MTATAPNVTTTSKGYKKISVKEKGLGEKTSLSFNKKENPSQKPPADFPCCFIGQDWVPSLPQD